ncbi:hypothetical protein QO002_003403 [Pararhizobium capsulatum DSM 1112]|uniref:Uncharacterized protein n=1 Tax=Pararhizobium capsulatum DSM 1112 TaxID=1121113 RepID=A0ABU0BSN6_9HYPH|nr:hypothetical protein [Pararhizobium capsulatum]MDQ0321265.1 hypothetical protein [Pararhizobium capsulatum DSM 1112]
MADGKAQRMEVALGFIRSQRENISPQNKAVGERSQKSQLYVDNNSHVFYVAKGRRMTFRRDKRHIAQPAPRAHCLGSQPGSS